MKNKEIMIYEGDAVIVEPYGAIGIVSAVLIFDELDADSSYFQYTRIQDWQDYWLNNHKFHLDVFDKVLKVIFPGNEHTFDYPITAIRKIIHFKKFNKYKLWNYRYQCDYVPIWKVFKRFRLYYNRLIENRRNDLSISQVYGVNLKNRRFIIWKSQKRQI